MPSAASVKTPINLELASSSPPEDMGSVKDRALVTRAYEEWAAGAAIGRFPDWQDVLQCGNGALQQHALAIRIDDNFRQSPILHIGSELTREMGGQTLPIVIKEVPSLSLLSRITEHALEPIANLAPIGFEAEFEDDGGRHLAYHAIVLPCTGDSGIVDTVVGFIGFKVVSEAAAADKPTAPPPGKTNSKPQNLKDTLGAFMDTKLADIMAIDGALAVAIVDIESGMLVASSGNTKSLDLEVAAAGNTNVMRAKMKTMADLGLKEEIEDILITLCTQYHMIRPLSSETGKGLFIYLALDKSKANLAMARHKLRIAEKSLEV